MISYFTRSSNNSSRQSSVTKHERELKDKVFDLTNQVGNGERLIETLKESHRIVLDTKESVVRSLLKQNQELSFEKDSLHAKLESLQTALDQNTLLLRNIQIANTENSIGFASSASGNIKIVGGGVAKYT